MLTQELSVRGLSQVLSEGIHMVEYRNKAGERKIRNLTRDPRHTPQTDVVMPSKRRPQEHLVFAYAPEDRRWVSLDPANVISMN